MNFNVSMFFQGGLLRSFLDRLQQHSGLIVPTLLCTGVGSRVSCHSWACTVKGILWDFNALGESPRFDWSPRLYLWGDLNCGDGVLVGKTKCEKKWRNNRASRFNLIIINSRAFAETCFSPESRSFVHRRQETNLVFQPKQTSILTCHTVLPKRCSCFHKVQFLTKRRKQPRKPPETAPRPVIWIGIRCLQAFFVSKGMICLNRRLRGLISPLRLSPQRRLKDVYIANGPVLRKMNQCGKRSVCDEDA